MNNLFHEYPVAEVLAHYSLGELLDYKPITLNTKHASFLLVTTEGLFALTVVKNIPFADLANRLRFNQFLHDHSISCPRIIPTLTEESCLKHLEYVVFINEWLLGEAILEGNQEQCASLGKLLGQIHNLSTNFADSNSIRQPITIPNLYLERLLDLLPITEALLIQEELGFQHFELRGMLPKGIVHGHLTANQILFSGNFILGVLGYYQAQNDAFLLDLAFAVNHWCCDEKGNTHEKHAISLLDNYQSHRPFTSLETQHWTSMRRAAALQIWLTELTHQLELESFIIESPAALKQKNILLQLSKIPKF